MYDFVTLKVMNVCINAYASYCDVFSFSVTYPFKPDLSKVRLPNSLLALTHKLSQCPIPEKPDSIKFQLMCFRNCWYAAIFESSASNQTLKTGETVCHVSR